MGSAINITCAIRILAHGYDSSGIAHIQYIQVLSLTSETHDPHSRKPHWM